MPHLPIVAAHVEFLVLRGDPQMHAWVLVAGDEPPAVRRPHERMDAVAVVKLLLRDEIVGAYGGRDIFEVPIAAGVLDVVLPVVARGGVAAPAPHRQIQFGGE